MADIRVDPDILDQKAKDIRTYKQQHDDAITKLNSLVDALNSEWLGTAKSNYVNAYQEFKGSFNAFSERMEELAKALENMANKYRIADGQGG